MAHGLAVAEMARQDPKVCELLVSNVFNGTEIAMAITQPSKRNKSDDFAAATPDARLVPKLRDKRQPLAFTLPPDEIIAGIDAMMIEIILRRFLQMREGRHREAA
jgi:hypothetical protein